MARVLEDTGEFRVLRRLVPRNRFIDTAESELKSAIVLDIETTGLDPVSDEIIELGMIRFWYTADDRVHSVEEEFSALREPSGPISSDIKDLTGITQEMVYGARISSAEVSKFLRPVQLVIAHNAAFDRPFVERLFPATKEMAWACSATEINWKGVGFESAALSQLLNSYGWYHSGHRALEDCRALLAILARELPTGEPVFRHLLSSARKSWTRIWAEDAPFEQKDVLKDRGYRWADGRFGGRRSWWKDVAAKEVDDELQFLRQNVYSSDALIPTAELTAFDRFSERAR